MANLQWRANVSGAGITGYAIHFVNNATESGAFFWVNPRRRRSEYFVMIFFKKKWG